MKVSCQLAIVDEEGVSSIRGVVAFMCFRDYRSWRDDLWEPFFGLIATVVCIAAFRVLLRFKAPALHERLRRYGW